jgi:hypothetical protein
MGRGGVEEGAPEVHSELELRELRRTCGVRSMDSEWGAKSRVEYKPASSM